MTRLRLRGRPAIARALRLSGAAVAAFSAALALFRLRNVATANVAGVLWAASMFAAFFISALYLIAAADFFILVLGNNL
mgnify:CR=1 FL=1